MTVRPWSALVVPPSIDGPTLARFAALQIGPTQQANWWLGATPIPGVLVTPVPFSQTTLAPLLEMLVQFNLEHLCHNPHTPSVYDSGVHYRHEIPDRPEQWLSIPWLFQAAQRPDVLADCKGLSAARVAELRLRGEHRASCVSSVQRIGGRTVVHIRVQRADGSLEDPSALLGMNRAPGGVTWTR